MPKYVTGPLKAVAGVFLTDPTQPRYVREVSDLSGYPSGTVSPMLSRLAQEGVLEDLGYELVGRAARRYYRLTETGRAELEGIVDTNRKDKP